MTAVHDLATVPPERLLHPSVQRPDRPVGPDALVHIALGLAETVPRAEVAPARGDVARHRILSTPVYDAWLVELGPQTSIEPHDHDGSIGVIAVTSGRLIEFDLDDDGLRRSRLRQLVTGDRTVVGVTSRHSLANPDWTAAATIQVFSPPLGSDGHS